MNQNNRQETFPILGMSCAACAARVDKTLNKQPGVCQVQTVVQRHHHHVALACQ